MKNTFLLLMLLVLSSTLFLACEADETGEVVTKTNALVPLISGNRWVYKNTYYASWNDMQIVGVDTNQQMVIGPYSIEGEGYYSMYYTDAKYNTSTLHFLTGNDEDGNLVNHGAVSGEDTLLFNSMFLKKNATVGEMWTTSDVRVKNEDNSLVEVHYSVKCLSIDTVVTTSKGQFHCMSFECVTNQISRTRIYASTKIGIVRSELYYDDRLRSKKELIDYKLY